MGVGMGVWGGGCGEGRAREQEKKVCVCDMCVVFVRTPGDEAGTGVWTVEGVGWPWRCVASWQGLNFGA